MPFLLMFLGFIAVVAIIATIVLWVMSIYYAATSKSKELEGSRVLWIILIVFTGSIGSVIYFFVDGKKREGIITLVSLLVLPLVLVLYAIILFVFAVNVETSQDGRYLNQEETMQLEDLDWAELELTM